MRQDQVTVGGEYIVRVGSRLAPVTVTGTRTRRSWSRSRGETRSTVFVCLTGDTRREIVASAARLRPVPGAVVPPSRAAEADARRAAARVEKAAQAAADAALAIYGRAAAEFSPAWTAEGLRDHAEAWMARLPGEGSRVDHRAAILRALDADPGIANRAAWDEIAAAGRRCSAGGPLVDPAPAPVRVNRRRPVEMPVGRNREVLADTVGRRHVAESLLTVARAVRRRVGRLGTRALPVPMRRGLWLAVATMHDGNRRTYRAVMGHDALPTERMIADAVAAAAGLGRCP